MSKITIIEGNSSDKDNVRVIMVKGEKGEKGDPTKLSQLENDTGFITKAEANLDNYYNKSEIDTTVTNLNNTIDEKADTTAIQNQIDTINSTKANTSDVADTYETKTNHNNDISTLNSQISSLASGSPLVASSVSGMTDTSRIYVLTTNGNWYYYNGSSWVSGGVYQATQIENGSITPEKTNFLEKKLNENNVYDESQVIEGYYVGNSITPISNSSWGYYETTDLETGTTYCFDGPGHMIISAFSGDNNVLLHDTANGNYQFTIPTNATKIFISTTLASKTNSWINKGTIQFNHLTPYQKYYIIDENKINMNKYKLAKIVDINGNGDYTSLSTAVANASSGDTIIVMPGIYDDEKVECWGKSLNIIGINRDTCIIKNNYCDYDRPPIEFSVGILRNLSFISEYNETNYNATNFKSYAIHIEDDYQANKSMLIENCYFESQCNYAVGMGTRGGANIEFNNCDMIGANPVNGQGGLYFHDAANSTYAGVQNIHFIGNRILTKYNGSSTDLRIESQGTTGSTVNVEFINNVNINNSTGTLVTRLVDHASETWKTKFDDLTNFNLTYSSFGNNNIKLNK